MKKSLLLAILTLSVSMNSFSSDGVIECGDQVLEIYDDLAISGNNYSLQTVKLISEGIYIMANGTQYSRDEIEVLVEEHSGVSVGDKVLTKGEYASLYNFQTVEAISEKGKFMLSNGGFYSRQEFEALIHEFKGIKVGEKVLVRPSDYNKIYKELTVEAISEKGNFLLSNKIHYSRSELEKTDSNELNGISVGEKVLVRASDYNDSYKELTVKTISENGNYLLSNGLDYSREEMKKIECASCSK